VPAKTAQKIAIGRISLPVLPGPGRDGRLWSKADMLFGCAQTCLSYDKKENV
jgi:hypothetical protein